MKLTTKCRYGTRAIAEISANFEIKPTKKREIVDNQNIPASYLENILVDLKRANLIKTIRGLNGGYELCRPPDSINLLDIVNALEGGLEPVRCLLDEVSCERESRCSTRKVWKELQEAQEKVLKKYDLRYLNGLSVDPDNEEKVVK